MDSRLTYHVTPWKLQADLRRVRDDLFPENHSQRSLSALKLIEAWKLRGNLPHAIESTGLLLQAKAFHRYQNAAPRASGEQQPPSVFPIRATYTVALTRFVTGFADIGRHKSGPNQSMLEVAAAVGLPLHFVELRHEATHGEMPSLDRLVALGDEAINWLWTTYWSKLDLDTAAEADERLAVQSSHASNRTSALLLPIVDSENAAQMAGETRELLRDYRRIAKDVVQTGQKLSSQEILVFASDLLHTAAFNSASLKVVATTLCSPGFLIPSDGRISNLIKQMQTAFAMFEPLLHHIACESEKIMKALLRQFVMQNTTYKASSNDAGLLLWAERIFDDPQWVALLGPRHRGLVLYYCRQVCKYAASPGQQQFLAPVERSMRELHLEDRDWWERLTKPEEDAEMVEAAR